jgi:hypothetical protein
VVEAVVADGGGRLVGQEGFAAPDVVLEPVRWEPTRRQELLGRLGHA